MRGSWLLVLLIVSCGSTVAAPTSATTPSPIPWISAVPHPTPAPTATPPPRPTGIARCAAADIAGVFTGGQGATGWITRGFALGNRAAFPCLIEGLVRAAYLDAEDHVIVATSPEFASLNWAWVVLGPYSAPETTDDRRDGEATIGLATYGDCGSAQLSAVALTFAPPTGEIRIPMRPARVGGRCDVPGATLSLGIFSPLGPAWWSSKPTAPTAAPAQLAYSLVAATVAFAGEPLRYELRVRNISNVAYVWSECPAYLEWLGGHALTPSAPPPDQGLKADPGFAQYAGGTKQAHVLNCGAAGPLAPGAEIAFEMIIDVPRDAYGLDTLRWDIAGPGIRQVASAQIQFLAARR